MGLIGSWVGGAPKAKEVKHLNHRETLYRKTKNKQKFWQKETWIQVRAETKHLTNEENNEARQGGANLDRQLAIQDLEPQMRSMTREEGSH